MKSRRMRDCMRPRLPMYVIEVDQQVTREWAAELQQIWQIARLARVPLPLVMGPGVRVKEIKR